MLSGAPSFRWDDYGELLEYFFGNFPASHTSVEKLKEGLPILNKSHPQILV